MFKTLFILPFFLFLVSCKQNAPKQKAIIEIAKKDSFELNDTSANVKELISYNRTRYTFLEHLPDFLTKFIQKGYAPLDTLSADLNADGIRDFFLATYKIGEDSISPSPKRSLKLLLGKKDGSFRLEHESLNVLPPLNMGGFSDPYPGIIVEKGCFIIQFAGGSNWKETRATKFEYSETAKDWIQTQEITESYFMDKRHYESDTTTAKQFGRLTFKKNY